MISPTPHYPLPEPSPDFNLLLILDPYCRMCQNRNQILRFHQISIHIDESMPDFHDDPKPWSTIGEDEKRRPH